MTSKRKRSSTLKLTTMLAGAASFTITACDRAGSSAQWDQPSPAQDEQVQAFAYSSLEACKQAGEVSDADCQAGWAAARNDDTTHAPRYGERASCEDVYGAGACVPRQAGGSSFFTPLLAGFVIGQMLDNFGRPYYRGTSLYREDERYGGGYSSGWGGSLGRDYNTGRTVISRQGVEPAEAMRQAPPRMQTRTAVVSRGGFGGGRGFGFGS